MKKIETSRLVIRQLEMNDAKAAHELFCDEEAMRWLGMYPALTTMEESRERIAEWREDQEELRYAIASRDNDLFMGYIAVNPDSEEEREDTRELGFAMIAGYRHQGFMKEALQAVLRELKQEGVKYVWACCFKGNEASEKLIFSLGFELMQEGTYEVEGDREYESLECRIEL